MVGEKLTTEEMCGMKFVLFLLLDVRRLPLVPTQALKQVQIENWLHKGRSGNA
jgi:hypothetical protein